MSASPRSTMSIESGQPITTRYGFFIEDIDDVARAQRPGAAAGREPHIASSQLDPEAAARFAVFQYMISNLDWAMTASPAGDGLLSQFQAARRQGRDDGPDHRAL